MKESPPIKVLAVTTIVAAWSLFYVLQHPRPPRIDDRPHEALGRILATEALHSLAPGARLIVIARDPKPYTVPACAIQLDSFLKTVRQAGKTVTDLRPIRLDPLRPVAVPPGDFYDLLRLGRPDDVIVSFLGPPVLSPDQVVALEGKRPTVLAVCPTIDSDAVELAQGFAQGLLKAAIVQRSNAPAHASRGTPQHAFEQIFHMVKADSGPNSSETPPGRH